MKNKKVLILSLFATIGIICITVGLSLAFFTYSQQGTTDNVITTGSVTFIYTETSTVGRGINITDAFPTTDEAGKALIGDDNVFNFNINSEPGNSTIDYEITARKSNNSTLSDEVVKVYLTKVSGVVEEEILLDNYKNLTQTTKNNTYTEKVLYRETVPANDTYSQDYRLRMWVDENTDYTDGNYNNKTFTITVNVYANGTVVQGPLAQKLSDTILANNALVTSAPTLTTTSSDANENGLYSSTDTNSGDATYYFRGNVNNNYVSFAGLTWRIVRINEDGTIRLIMQDGINNNTIYPFNTEYNDYKYMYYTNSGIKSTLINWYTDNLSSYNDKIATGDYFCEQAKVKDAIYTATPFSMTDYDKYTPDFKCKDDINGHGLVNTSIGLITYDELLYAGAYPFQECNDYYLNNLETQWTMSPAGVFDSSAYAWFTDISGRTTYFAVNSSQAARPVINLKADVTVTGTGTSTDPYVVE